MPDDNVDVLVIGSGLCGLAIAVTAARRGLSVRCVGDGRAGASLANFGQWHSGAVYAPVLPDVAHACWQHRDQWRHLIGPASVGRPHGIALFDTVEAVDRYRDAWHQIGIDVVEMDPRTVEPLPPAAAAFRIPDRSVHLPTLHAGLADLARAHGVPPEQPRDTTLHRDPDTTIVSAGAALPPARTVVLATGAGTPDLLSKAGMSHTLRTRRIAWGRCSADVPHLTYWLDGDLLALSPDRGGVRIGLPGVAGRYGSTAIEDTRLQAALARRGIRPPDQDFHLSWGAVCEPLDAGADPSALVVDLRHPPPGWTRAANLIVALPGKWTTAWQCADRVVEMIA